MTGAPASTAAPAAPANGGEGVDPFSPDQTADLEDVFGFGEPASKVDEKTTEEKKSVGADDGEDPGPEEKSSAPGSEPAPPTDEELERASLRAQLKELQDAEAARKAAEEQKPAVEEKPTAEAPKTPDPVSIKLPDAMLNRIFGEDGNDAAAAMNELISGVMTSMNNSFHQMSAAIPQIIEAKVKEALDAAGKTPAAKAGDPAPVDADSTADSMRQQYFEKFPQHNKPEIQPVLQAVAVEMARQFPGHAWNDRYIASLGARVTDRMKKMAELTNPSSSAPTSLLPAGSRSADPVPGGEDLSDEIMETLGFG